MPCDFVVVGGGIAGIAVAELLQRSGREVVVIERNARLCVESSAAQQGWFHSGALYAALPNRKYLKLGMENLANLTHFYAGFPGMNLLSSGERTVPSGNRQWFQDSTFFYVYADSSTADLSFSQQCYWPMAKAMARRSLRKNFGATDLALLPATLLESKNASDILSSRDRTMDTYAIAQDLVNSFMSRGGRVVLNSEVISIERNLVHHRGGKEKANFIIVSSGDSIPNLCKQMVSTIQSPILVLDRALAAFNFVNMHPQREKTFNHVLHEVGGEQYSVIANAQYFRDKPDLAKLHRSLLVSTNKQFGKSLTKESSAIFLGKKTEISTAWWSPRNYRPVVADTEHSTIALPGKFSFCFTLAIDVCRHFGIEPEKETALTEAYHGIPIQAPEHATRFRKLRGHGVVHGALAKDVSQVRKIQ